MPDTDATQTEQGTVQWAIAMSLAFVELVPAIVVGGFIYTLVGIGFVELLRYNDVPIAQDSPEYVVVAFIGILLAMKLLPSAQRRLADCE